MFLTLIGRQARLDRWPPTVTAKLQVSVDGDALRDPIGFDTHRGWADFHARDDKGRVLRVRGAAQVRRVHGAVRAVLRRATVADADSLARRGVIFA